MAENVDFSHKRRDAKYLGPNAKFLVRQNFLCWRRRTNTRQGGLVEQSSSKEWSGVRRTGPVSALSVKDLGAGGVRKSGRAVGSRPGRKETSTIYSIHLCINEHWPHTCCGPGTVLGSKTMTTVKFLSSQSLHISGGTENTWKEK